MSFYDAIRIVDDLQTEANRDAIQQAVTEAEEAHFLRWLGAIHDQRPRIAYEKRIEARALARASRAIEANARADITQPGVLPPDPTK